jgi:two-component system nitrogen regulation response regulator GlnG
VTHVLIVDDEPSICWAFRECLTDEGYTVDIAGTAEQALTSTERRTPDVIVMDVRLPGMDGLTALEKLQARSGSIPVIIMTAFGSLSTAVRAIDGGAFDYLTKPIDLDKAVSVVRQAVNAQSAAAQVAAADPSHEATSGSDELLVGKSPAMQEVFRRIALVAERNVPVLITGESGTGKDLVARAIHLHSRRRGAFVPICVPALSETVVESELFGHARGAFTGADQERRGLLELANDGTAFIDEIGDVSLNLQVKLLRTLETGEVRPVGSGTCRHASFRLVAATNRKLEQRVTDGHFRSDLFFRLNVFRIDLPSLRERPEDIPLLVERFLREATAGSGKISMSAAAMAELQSRSWVGNVRELHNVVEAAVVVCRGDTVLPEHLPAPVQSMSHSVDSALQVNNVEEQLQIAVAAWTDGRLESEKNLTNLYEQFLQAAEPSLLAAVLKHAKGNRASASRILGIHRETLREKLKRLDDGSADKQ